MPIGQQLPLYAPVDMTLTQAAYCKIGTDPTYKPEYSPFFDAGCGFTLQLYHVKGVVRAVAGVVPKNPVPSSASADGRDKPTISSMHTASQVITSMHVNPDRGSTTR